MRIPRIYYLGKLNSDSEVELSPQASHHINNVLRLKIKSPVILFNGDGNEYFSHIINLHKKTVLIKVDRIEKRNNESPLKIHLLQGISKGDRMDFTLQKAVELGVQRITPVITEYCQVKLDQARSLKKQAHWQSIIISACEQSGRCVLPELNHPQPFSNIILENRSDIKLICHPDEIPRSLKNLSPPNYVSLLIGPEGGFSDQELQQAIQNNFRPISLGPRILRTETAALAAIAFLQSIWGDLG